MLDAKYAVAIYNRGNAHFAKGEADRAIANYDQALAINPKYEDALVNRGVAHEKKGDLDRAIADYDEALRLEPKDAVAYNNRGNALFKKRDYDRALARLRSRDQARRQVCRRLFQPRHRLRGQEAFRIR